MISHEIFDAKWADVVAVLRAIADKAVFENPSLRWSAGHHRTPFYVFRGYVSFSRSGDLQDEDVVFSLDARETKSKVEISWDLARGDGELLAEGAGCVVSTAQSVQSVEAGLDSCIDAVERFLHEQESLLFKELLGGINAP